MGEFMCRCVSHLCLWLRSKSSHTLKACSALLPALSLDVNGWAHTYCFTLHMQVITLYHFETGIFLKSYV